VSTAGDRSTRWTNVPGAANVAAMRIADLNWMQVEELLGREDRAVLPVGSTEQHAYLSLATDGVLAERVAVEAAEPLGVPVFPVLNYGITPDFMGFPGTVTLSRQTFVAAVIEILDAIATHGFRRILVVNGHGGNAPAAADVRSWASRRKVNGKPLRLEWHNWWAAPKFRASVQSIDPNASHASWMENFPWTRVEGASAPGAAKPMIDFAHYKTLDPSGVRTYLADGCFGGRYARPDEDVLAVWQAGIAETRELIEGMR